MLHHTQQVEETSTETQTETERRDLETRLWNEKASSLGCVFVCVFLPLVNALSVGIPQKPPVVPNFNQTLDTITQLQVFVIQTLLGHKKQ